VRLSTKQAWLEDHGRATFGPVRIMYGAPGLDTPTGTFHVIWKAAELISNIYGTPMPHSVFFAPGGIAFHEGSLTEYSHGCVHLSASDATTFFNALEPGAVVQVLP
jgi:lipoprotein-anchoring transpeptidase ErfK/SrfK